MRVSACRSGLILAALAVVSLAGVARGQEGFEPPKPTKEHKELESEVGTWDATVKTWIDPSGDPMESKGVETNKLMPGGLWLLSEFKGDFGGMAFEGRGQTGYDPHKKKFIGTWIDSMTNGMMVMEGTYDEKSHTMTFTGTMFDEMRKADTKFKMVSVAKDENTRVATMYTVDGGKEVKNMEITYKKRK
jgi:hypothetical protein